MYLKQKKTLKLNLNKKDLIKAFSVEIYKTLFSSNKKFVSHKLAYNSFTHIKKNKNILFNYKSKKIKIKIIITIIMAT